MTSNTAVAHKNDPKRVLYVITKANWGGAQRYVFDLALAGKDAGKDVLVVVGGEGTLSERLMEHGIRVRVISAMRRDISFMSEVRSFRTLLRIVKDFKPDVVHGNSSKAGALAALAARIAGVPRIVFSAHGWAFNEKRPFIQKVIIAKLHYATVLLSHATICVSGAIRQDAAWMPFVQKRLQVIHNGVAPGALLPRSEARARLCPELVRSYPTALWIGTIAELHPTKGLDTLIEAFAAIAHDLPVVLVIMGDGQEWARLEKLVQIYDFPDRVVLTGFVKDASTYLPAFDLFVLPSRSEALGYVLLEAGLASLPAIGTRVGGIPEVLEDDVSGLLVPAGKSVMLADSISELVKSKELRARLGTALHQKVLDEFSIESMIEKTFALYNT